MGVDPTVDMSHGGVQEVEGAQPRRSFLLYCILVLGCMFTLRPGGIKAGLRFSVEDAARHTLPGSTERMLGLFGG